MLARRVSQLRQCKPQHKAFSSMVPRPLPYPNTHPNKGTHGANTYTGHFFATYPSQNYEILRRIYWKRRGYFMAVNIPSLPEIEQLSPSIWRILGSNPSKFTLQGTNTYLLGSGSERILVDTAQGFSQWADALNGLLDREKATVSTCILTHWHHDHVMGIGDVRKRNPKVKVYKHLGNGYDPDQTMQGQEILDFADGEKFGVDGIEVRALHSPGHARDHMCLVVTEGEDAGSIFTADNVLGHGTAVFENLGQYVASLKLMKKNVADEGRAFPGHGAVIQDARGKLDEYITHRQMREDEALNVLCYGTTVAPGKEPLKSAEGFPQSVPSEGQLVFGKEWESMEMVKIIYRMYPENLWGPAEGGLLQVLDKLKNDGKVVKVGEKWRVSEELMKTVVAEAGKYRSKSPNKL